LRDWVISGRMCAHKDLQAYGLLIHESCPRRLEWRERVWEGGSRRGHKCVGCVFVCTLVWAGVRVNEWCGWGCVDCERYRAKWIAAQCGLFKINEWKQEKKKEHHVFENRIFDKCIHQSYIFAYIHAYSSAPVRFWPLNETCLCQTSPHTLWRGNTWAGKCDYSELKKIYSSKYLKWNPCRPHKRPF